jgi:SSS family solute:Na+ symporter
VLATVISALTIFYSVIVVSLFVPILAGLYIRRANANAALVSMAAGVITLFVARFIVAPSGWWRDPLLLGLAAAAIGFATVVALHSSTRQESR